MLLLKSLLCIVGLYFGNQPFNRSALVGEGVPEHSASIEQVRGPQITFDTMYRDLQIVKTGTIVNRDFIIGNSGTSALVILSVRPAHGNIQVSMEDSLIDPGTIAYLHVRFDTRGEQPGLITRSIVIESNSITDANSIVGFHAMLENPLQGNSTIHH